ncbi:MAG: DASS family sodium-coupled anion symporter [Saprospiraceae bacterium]|nr:DASS family sodium-coupled anion symporter [Saprospiraceae bacterium]MDW8229856.1 DASS family sodium-coupled anion symporter [Saprospiraceae bacterium]
MQRSTLALITGPLAFLLFAAAPIFSDMAPAARMALGITAWMAIWWISEVVHVTVTALLPLVLFPLCGILPLKKVSAEFGNEIIFLFLSGLLFGQAIERWGLHARIALNLVRWMGNRPARIVLGFMVATGFLSMWISNTATAVMMTPVAIAVSSGQFEDTATGSANFRKALMLGVAYACSIGGVATLIGTPTNAVFLSFVKSQMNVEVSFWQWFAFAFPFSVLLMALCWLLLMRLYPPERTPLGDAEYRATLKAYLDRLGPMSVAERRLMVLFGMVILSWLTGSLLWYRWVPNSSDVLVAVCGALLLFVVPAGGGEKPRAALLDWPTASRVPWGVLFFFGGGLALARGFESSGLAGWLGAQMRGLSEWHPLLIALAVFTVVSFISEIASNIATASIMMPVLAALAQAIGLDPFGMLLGAAISASFGFALPVATAPNTIVFSSGYLNTRDMARAGLWLDFIAVLLLLAFAYVALPLVWGLRLGH